MTLHAKAPFAHVVTPEELAERLDGKLPWHRPECPEVPQEKPQALTNEPSFDDNLKAVTEEGVLVVRFQRALDGLRDRRLEYAHRAVLAELLEEMNSKKGTCWTLRKTIAERLGMTVKRVNDVLYDLRTWGYISWERQPLQKGSGKPVMQFFIPLALMPRATLQEKIAAAIAELRKLPRPRSTPPVEHTPPAGTETAPPAGKKGGSLSIEEPIEEPGEAPTPKKPQRKSSKPKVSEDEIEAAVAAYNAEAKRHGFTVCKTVTGERRHKLAKRLPEIGGVEGFKRALTAIPRNKFMMGQLPARDGGDPFKLHIDYLLQAHGKSGDVLAKLLDAADDTTPSRSAAPTNRNSRGEVVF
jgi:hypothetical protein